jgi:F-box and leucine-rich repeat protein GRR1
VVSLSRLSRIESLRLNRNENITDVGVMSLATPGIPSSLKRIHLSFCTNVTAFSVYHLLSVHRQITFVSVSGIPDFLGDSALLKLSKPVDRVSKRI